MPQSRPRRPVLTRADLPGEFTPETVRALPIATLRRLADHRNAVLTFEEQQAFDRAIHEVMGQTAERVSQQLTRADWAAVRRDQLQRGARGRTSRADQQLDRLAKRIGRQVDLAGELAPNVDWSFAQPPSPPTTTTGQEADVDVDVDVDADTDAASSPDTDADTDADAADTTGAADAAFSTGTADDQSGTVSDLEQRISEQVELVEVMTEIAEVSKRTYSLEQQRDLQNTRTVFFGFVVSVAVIVAGWAPLVAAEDWTERLWIIVLTVATCVIGGVVYGLVRRRQNHLAAEEEAEDAAAADR